MGTYVMKGWKVDGSGRLRAQLPHPTQNALLSCFVACLSFGWNTSPEGAESADLISNSGSAADIDISFSVSCWNTWQSLQSGCSILNP